MGAASETRQSSARDAQPFVVSQFGIPQRPALSMPIGSRSPTGLFRAPVYAAPAPLCAGESDPVGAPLAGTQGLHPAHVYHRQKASLQAGRGHRQFHLSPHRVPPRLSDAQGETPGEDSMARGES